MTAASDFRVRYETAKREHERRTGKRSPAPSKPRRKPTAKDYGASALSALSSAANPVDTGLEVGQQIGAAVPRVMGDIAGYFMGNSPSDVGRDVRRGAQAVGSYLSDPYNAASTALDFIPGIGDIKGLGQDWQNAAQLRAEGNVAGARDLERLAIPLAVAGIVPGISEARGAVRAAEEGLDVARAARQSRQFTQAEIERAALAAEAASKNRATSFGVPLERPGTEPISSQAARLGMPIDTPEMFYAQHGTQSRGYHTTKPATPAEEVSFTVSPTVDMPARQVVPTESLEGKFLVGLPADKKVAGVTLESVNGQPLAVPRPLRGGPLYPEEQGVLGTGLGWANQEEAAGPMRGALQSILERGGTPIGTTVTMGPHSLDQTMGMAGVLANLMPGAEVSARDLASINDRFRGGFGSGKDAFAPLPDFPGIESPEFLDYMRGLSMPTRASIIKALDSAAVGRMGVPEIGAARVAMTQPELIHTPSGATGFSLVNFGPESLNRVENAPAVGTSTYGSPTLATAGGKLNVLHPLETTFLDFYKKRRAGNKSPGSDFRSFTLQPVVQEVTPEVLDSMMRYEEAIKRYQD